MEFLVLREGILRSLHACDVGEADAINRAEVLRKERSLSAASLVKESSIFHIY